MNKFRFFLLWSGVLSSVLVVPYSLVWLGVGWSKSMGFGIMVIALLIDGFTTKAGMKNGCTEMSPLYRLINKRVGLMAYVIITKVLGAILGLFVVVFLPLEATLFFAVLFLIGGLGNSVVLSSSGVTVHPRNNRQPEEEDSNESGGHMPPLP